MFSLKLTILSASRRAKMEKAADETESSAVADDRRRAGAARTVSRARRRGSADSRARGGVPLRARRIHRPAGVSPRLGLRVARRVGYRLVAGGLARRREPLHRRRGTADANR